VIHKVFSDATRNPKPCLNPRKLTYLAFKRFGQYMDLELPLSSQCKLINKYEYIPRVKCESKYRCAPSFMARSRQSLHIQS